MGIPPTERSGGYLGGNAVGFTRVIGRDEPVPHLGYIGESKASRRVSIRWVGFAATSRSTRSPTYAKARLFLSADRRGSGACAGYVSVGVFDLQMIVENDVL
jgi:hypothetical protein